MRFRCILIVLACLSMVSGALEIEGENGIVMVPAVPPLEIDIWTDRGERSVYYPGEEIHIYFKVSDDAFVVVYDVDTDGRVKLLYPMDPESSMPTRGGRTYRLPPTTSAWNYHISGPTGIEYVVAVASPEPFYWGEYMEDIAGSGVFETISTDPQLGIERINQFIAPTRNDMPYYVSDKTMFYVERRVPYPRYMCYDCHWPWHWDPYYDICPAFEVVIYTSYRNYYYHPPYSRYDRRPYYWYKKKTNKDYPRIKSKYKSGGSDYWNRRGKRVITVNGSDKYKDSGERDTDDNSRWKKQDSSDSDSYRPGGRVTNFPSREKRTKQGDSNEERTKQGESEEQRTKRGDINERRTKDETDDASLRKTETRPLYREEKQQAKKPSQERQEERRQGRSDGGSSGRGSTDKPSSREKPTSSQGSSRQPESSQTQTEERNTSTSSSDGSSSSTRQRSGGSR